MAAPVDADGEIEVCDLIGLSVHFFPSQRLPAQQIRLRTRIGQVGGLHGYQGGLPCPQVCISAQQIRD